MGGGTWAVVGTDQNTYNTGALTQTTTYRVFVNADESGCEDVYSSNVTVIVTPDISITAQPVGGSICTGGDFTLSVTASGSPDIHYQWQQNTGPGTWIVVGTDLPTYNTGVLTQTTIYRVFVNADESGCEDVYSSEVTVTVTPDISISAQPVGGSICTGGNFNLSVTASGSPDIHYQWQQNTGPGTWIIVGADQNTYNTGALTATTQYRVFVNADESGCEDVYSTQVEVTVTPDINITAQPVGGSICVGGNFDLSITAFGSPVIHYQWQSFDGSAWSVVGSDLPSYNTGALTQTTEYRVYLYSDVTGCDDIYSIEVEVIVEPDLLITAEPTNINECIGGTDQMIVTVTGGSGIISYQWQSSIDGNEPCGNATGAGALTNAFTPPSTAAGTTYYRALINASNNGCQQVVTTTATAIISPDILISAQPTPVNECIGGTDQMTVNITGGSGLIAYQWQSSADGNEPWSNATGTGSTTNTFTPPSTFAGTTYYRVLVNASNSDCQQAVSNVATATISADIMVI